MAYHETPVSLEELPIKAHSVKYGLDRDDFINMHQTIIAYDENKQSLGRFFRVYDLNTQSFGPIQKDERVYMVMSNGEDRMVRDRPFDESAYPFTPIT